MWSRMGTQPLPNAAKASVEVAPLLDMSLDMTL
jgi:hypothetical protein